MPNGVLPSEMTKSAEIDHAESAKETEALSTLMPERNPPLRLLRNDSTKAGVFPARLPAVTLLATTLRNSCAMSAPPVRLTAFAGPDGCGKLYVSRTPGMFVLNCGCPLADAS